MVTDSRGKPLASTSPTGYGPAQFRGAYNLPSSGGSGQTIAIVDAYDDPTIEADLGVFSSTYGLTACTTANGCFTKVNQDGVQGSYPSANAGWALEIALDVETAHAICQSCHILLVEADSNSFANLEAAVATAAQLGATEISNSYGGGEFIGEDDSAYNRPGIAVTVSSGDGGYGAEFPAASPKVVAVGGTTLNLGANNTYGSETVWSGAGSGCSELESAQSWQTGDSHWAATGCASARGVADVAADADPNTGASVYDTTTYKGQSGWFTVGGTSLSAPLIAAVYGLGGGAGGVSYAASVPYAHQGSVHDVTSGSNGSCSTSMCKGAAGYDGPTGVGTPTGVAAFSAPGGADTTPPAVTLTAPADGAVTNDSTPTFSGAAGTASGDSSTVTLKVYSGGSASGSPVQTRSTTRSGSSWSVDASPALADGTYTAQAEQLDSSSNLGKSTAHTFSIDTVAPSPPSLTSPVDGSYSNSGSVAVAGAAEANSTVEVFDGATSKGTTAANGSGVWSKSLTGVADGSHTYTAKATDAAGNTSTASNARTVTVDTVAPDTSITAGPSGATNDSTPTFSFTSTEGGTFQCRIDGGTWTACSSPYTTGTLADGTHTFDVRAIDLASNADATPASRSFTVDTAAPAAPSITSPADGSYNNTGSVIVSGTAEANSTVEVFDGATSKGTTAANGSGVWSKSLTGVADGSHTYTAKATDTAGNTSTASNARTVTVDTVAPAAPSITAPADGSDNNTGSVTVSGTAEANSTVELFDGATSKGTTTASGGGSWSKSLSGVSDGSHTYTAKATDAAGNTSAASNARTVTIDTVAPDTTITGGPSGVTSDSTPTFSFTSTEPGSFECRVDGGSWATCSSPDTTATLSDGAHTFDVRAIDLATNVDATPASRSFSVDSTVDNVAPDVTLTAPANGAATTDSTPTFGGAAGTAAGDLPAVTVKVYAGSSASGGPLETLSTTASGSAWTVDASPALADGTYTVQAEQRDGAGNIGQSEAHTFTVDTSSLLPPAVPSSPPPSPSSSPSPGLTGAAAGLRSKTLPVTRTGLLLVRLTCPASAASAGCHGTLTVQSLQPATADGRRPVFARGRFKLTAGHSSTAKLRLSKAGRRALRRHGKLRARVLETWIDASGTAHRVVAGVVLRAPSRR